MNPQAATPERLAGYALVREAGRGAMSTVYEARDGKDRRVALKVLHAPATLAAAQQKALIDRLDREARVMLRLSHPNVVRLFDVGQEAGEHFIVMEYLDGQTLRTRLDGGPLSLVESSRVLDQIASALDAVHAEGIVHRDVKPSNVMLLPDGQVKLMDFGVARQGDDTTITQTGMIVGSPAYMSPEQVRGEENTHSTDLWALGILLYEMLAGHSPFTGSNVSTVLYRVAHETPAPLPGISNTVQQILRRALDKSPAKRYRTGREFADAFRLAVLGPAVKPQALPRQPQRWPWVALPVAAMLALLVGTVFFTRSHPRPAVAVSRPFAAPPDAVRTRVGASHQHSARLPNSRPKNALMRTTHMGKAGHPSFPKGPARTAFVPGGTVRAKTALPPQLAGPEATATIQEVTPSPIVAPPSRIASRVGPTMPGAIAPIPNPKGVTPKAVPRKAAGAKTPRKTQAKRRPTAPKSLPRRARQPRTTHRQRAAARQRNAARRRTWRVIYRRQYYPSQTQRLRNLQRFIYHDYY